MEEEPEIVFLHRRANGSVFILSLSTTLELFQHCGFFSLLAFFISSYHLLFTFFIIY